VADLFASSPVVQSLSGVCHLVGADISCTVSSFVQIIHADAIKSADAIKTVLTFPSACPCRSANSQTGHIKRRDAFTADNSSNSLSTTPLSQ